MMAIANALLVVLVILSSSQRGLAFVSQKAHQSSRRRNDRAGLTFIQSSYIHDIRKEYVVTNEEYLKEEIKEYSQPLLPSLADEKPLGGELERKPQDSKTFEGGAP